MRALSIGVSLSIAIHPRIFSKRISLHRPIRACHLQPARLPGKPKTATAARNQSNTQLRESRANGDPQDQEKPRRQ